MSNLFICSLCWVLFRQIAVATGCTYQVEKVESYQEEVCSDRAIGICWAHKLVARYRKTTVTKCCHGYGLSLILSGSCRPICSSSCHGHGTCVGPEECRCQNGYTGKACESPVCYPSCQHGTCIRPGFCTCFWGYTGRRCDTPICNPVCENGGQCISPYTCRCPAGMFTGPKCKDPICNPPCLNGGNCSLIRKCECPSTYRGPDCNTPVCYPQCQNGGTCIYPDTCSCRKAYTGKHCETPECSYHSPCFPGTCNDSVKCQCYEGFSGQNGLHRCKTMTSRRSPTITRCTSILANIERTGLKRELYRFITDSSEPNTTRVDTMWLNQKDYNYINVVFSAFYNEPENLAVPNYITNFKFGIVAGKIQITLQKEGRNGKII
ncbi:von Willebrand factor D and EGF domain-containing protein-like [Saccostrea cucullata]|uniref:von Willebrand factor D and EGF domain-containing protein-like n=1 Tax=Saccostrea cuccullata TaxID=36930 RepID=UPI002ED257EF